MQTTTELKKRAGEVPGHSELRKSAPVPGGGFAVCYRDGALHSVRIEANTPKADSIRALAILGFDIDSVRAFGG